MSNINKPKKIVWVISDGVPGHFNQSKGVLFALKYLFDLDIQWVELKLNKKFLRRPLSWLLNFKIPNLDYLYSFYHGDKLPNNSPDIVVGAGGNTAYAVVWISTALHAKNIFCGSLRHLNAELFDAILVLESDLPQPFIQLDVSPMPIDQQVLKEKAEQWRQERPLVSQVLWTMLIGGDGAGTIYQDSDWKILAEQMNALAQQFNIRWLVSTSRRTGENAEKILKEHLNPEITVDAVWWSETPRQILHAFLGLSERVYCSADSMSMIMESVSAMRPVVVYYPEKFKPDQRFDHVLNNLECKKLIYQLSILNLTEINLTKNSWKPLYDEPSVHLAHLVALTEIGK